MNIPKLSVCFATVVCAGALFAYVPEPETVGAWVFNGVADEEIVPDFAFPNLVPGSEMVCETVVSNSSRKVAPPARFVPDVPSDKLWSDCGKTNLMANLSTSVRLNSDKDDGYANSYLRLPNFGRMIKTCPDDSFTVELILRWKKSVVPFVTGMVGTSDASTPALAQTGHYICAPTNTAEGADAPAKLQPRNTSSPQYTTLEAGQTDSTRTLRDGNWHHLAYSWDGSSKQFIASYDYSRAREGVIKRPNGEPLAYDDNSYWQIAGTLRWGQNAGPGCAGIKDNPFDVVAVRVSKGILSAGQYMCLDGTVGDPDVVARFNFEQAAVGTVSGFTPELNLAATNLVGLGLFPNVSKVADSVNVYTNFTWKPAVVDNGRIRRSRQSLWSGPVAGDNKGLLFDTVLPPRFRASDDFTVEAIVYPVKSGKTRCLLFRETETGTTSLTTPRGTWTYKDSNKWGSFGLGYREADRLYLGMLQEDDVTGAVTNVYNATLKKAYSGALPVGNMAYGQWHHVAVTYDRSKTNTIRVWIDYKETHAYTFPEGQHLYRTNLADSHLQFFGQGWDDNGSALHGCVQDIRVTCRALEPEDFLKPSSGGFVLIYR